MNQGNHNEGSDDRSRIEHQLAALPAAFQQLIQADGPRTISDLRLTIAAVMAFGMDNSHKSDSLAEYCPGAGGRLLDLYKFLYSIDDPKPKE